MGMTFARTISALPVKKDDIKQMRNGADEEGFVAHTPHRRVSN